MEAHSITDPWNGAGETDVSGTEPIDASGRPLESSVDIEDSGTIRDAIEDVMNVLGFTYADLAAISTAANALSWLVAAAAYMGWL